VCLMFQFEADSDSESDLLGLLAAGAAVDVITMMDGHPGRAAAAARWAAGSDRDPAARMWITRRLVFIRRGTGNGEWQPAPFHKRSQCQDLYKNVE
jgi:hypothetical protein